MDDKQYVLSIHPNAVAKESAFGFKVYYRLGFCWIALSATWDTEEAAWRNAAAEVRRRRLMNLGVA